MTARKCPQLRGARATKQIPFGHWLGLPEWWEMGPRGVHRGGPWAPSTPPVICACSLFPFILPSLAPFPPFPHFSLFSFAGRNCPPPPAGGRGPEFPREKFRIRQRRPRDSGRHLVCLSLPRGPSVGPSTMFCHNPVLRPACVHLPFSTIPYPPGPSQQFLERSPSRRPAPKNLGFASSAPPRFCAVIRELGPPFPVISDAPGPPSISPSVPLAPDRGRPPFRPSGKRRKPDGGNVFSVVIEFRVFFLFCPAPQPPPRTAELPFSFLSPTAPCCSSQSAPALIPTCPPPAPNGGKERTPGGPPFFVCEVFRPTAKIRPAGSRHGDGPPISSPRAPSPLPGSNRPAPVRNSATEAQNGPVSPALNVLRAASGRPFRAPRVFFPSPLPLPYRPPSVFPPNSPLPLNQTLVRR